MNAAPIYDLAFRRWAPQPWGDSSGVLALINFFGGGAAIFVLGAIALAGMWTEYDGIVTVIGMVVLPFVVAIPSAVVAFLLGLPIRLVPPVARWWLRHGGYTLMGGAAGFVLVVVGSVLVRTSAEAESPEQVGWHVLLAGWVFFCLCATHTVWPRAWSTRGELPLPTA